MKAKACGVLILAGVILLGVHVRAKNSQRHPLPTPNVKQPTIPVSAVEAEVATPQPREIKPVPSQEQKAVMAKVREVLESLHLRIEEGNAGEEVLETLEDTHLGWFWEWKRGDWSLRFLCSNLQLISICLPAESPQAEAPPQISEATAVESARAFLWMWWPKFSLDRFDLATCEHSKSRRAWKLEFVESHPLDSPRFRSYAEVEVDDRSGQAVDFSLVDVSIEAQVRVSKDQARLRANDAMKRDQSSGSCRFIPRSERMKVDLIGKGAEATWMFLFEAECNHQDQHLKWVDVGIDAVNGSLREMNSSPRRR